MFENAEKTELSSLGEFGFIELIRGAFPLKLEQNIVGIGDDAAVIKPEEGKNILISTDTFVENVHFDIMYTPLKHLGYKTVVASVSDICAMNGKAHSVLISVSFSSKYTLEALEELFEGVRLACDKYSVDLVGGDTTTISKGLVVSVTVVGSANSEQIAKRSGANSGDLLCVTGDIGGAYMGLQLLEREKRVFLEHPEMQPDLQNHDYIVGRQLKPEARIDVVKWLNDSNIIPTSMIDISDGLASETLHLSKESDVAFAVHEEKLPVDQDTYNMAVEFGIDPTTAAMNGGEDFELLFTVDQKHYEELRNHPDITIIGYAREKSMKNQMISKQGNMYDLVAQGWKHF
ncbi:MAG: thiamine-phosphate kinase [Bacteroidetes bacterium]|nr:thiamine-phosphate kinase [Bacteroidota bacterium]